MTLLLIFFFSFVLSFLFSFLFVHDKAWIKSCTKRCYITLTGFEEREASSLLEVYAGSPCDVGDTAVFKHEALFWSDPVCPVMLPHCTANGLGEKKSCHSAVFQPTKGHLKELKLKRFMSGFPSMPFEVKLQDAFYFICNFNVKLSHSYCHFFSSIYYQLSEIWEWGWRFICRGRVVIEFRDWI